MVDVAAVPERLEDRVGKPQHHDVLRGFLAEVMVDAVGVRLRERLVHHWFSSCADRQVGAERLLDDHARPAALACLVEAGCCELGEDALEFRSARRTGKTAGSRGCRAPRRVARAAPQAACSPRHRRIRCGGKRCARQNWSTARRSAGLAGKLARRLLELRAECLVGLLSPGKADD